MCNRVFFSVECLTDAFISNQKGFPVLTKSHQQVLKSFFEIGSQVIINCKRGKVPGDYIHFKQYIEYVHGLVVRKKKTVSKSSLFEGLH